MYNQIREYLKNPTDINRKRMAKEIAKNTAAGTISDAARAWLKADQNNESVEEAEKILKSMFRC